MREAGRRIIGLPDGWILGLRQSPALLEPALQGDGDVLANSRPSPPGWEARLHGRQGCPPLRGLSELIRVNATKKLRFDGEGEA
jgi:hypothetical protein